MTDDGKPAGRLRHLVDAGAVDVLSLGEVIADFFANHPLRQFWLSGEPDHSLHDTNRSLTAALVDSEIVEKRILEAHRSGSTCVPFAQRAVWWST